ncbi:MAG TPA: hypothetical protein VK668_10270 [Mucilaginibacter sp.]|nr:hypothetical protein [Mucilaginibacter sp.]
MKITIFKACLIGVLAAFSITANANTTPAANDYKKIILDFIDSHMNANYKKLNKIMNDDATFKIPRGENVVVQTKAALVDDMKQTGQLKQNCQSKYEVVAQSSSLVIARVDFNYENTVQQNYLILEKNADKEWKITQVCKIFNDKDVAATEQKAIAKN